MSEARERPRCGLLNPSTVARCDCGYDFASGDMKESYLHAGERRQTGEDPTSRDTVRDARNNSRPPRAPVLLVASR